MTGLAPTSRREWEEAVWLAPVPTLTKGLVLRLGSYMTWQPSQQLLGVHGRPGMRRLCEGLQDLKPNTVAKHLRRAEEAGLVFLVRRSAPGRAREYRATVPLTARALAAAGVSDALDGRTDVRLSGAQDANGVTDVRLSSQNGRTDVLLKGPSVGPGGPQQSDADSAPPHQDHGTPHAGAHAHAREDGPQAGGDASGGQALPPAAAEALRAVLLGVPEARRAEVTAKMRSRLGEQLVWLVAAGWTVSDLTAHLVPGGRNQRTYVGAGSCGAVLETWAKQLREVEPPSVVRARELQRLREEQARGRAELQADPVAEAHPFDLLPVDEQERWREKAAADVASWPMKPSGEQLARVVESEARTLYGAHLEELVSP